MNRPEDVSAQYLRPMQPIPTGAEALLGEMKRYDAIFFDVYGTLLVSGAGEDDIPEDERPGVDRLPDLLQRYGIERGPEALGQALKKAIATDHRSYKARGIAFPEVDIRRVWRTILQSWDPLTVQRFAWEYEWITNPVFPMPGAAALIRACAAGNRWSGIISNAQFYTLWTLEDLFGEKLVARAFDPRLRFFSWREQHAKPSETMFRRARATLAKNGISPQSVLHVGNDMLNDIRPAAAVGFQTALFAGDRRSLRTRTDDQRCWGVRPDLVVTDLRQLLVATGRPSSGE